MKSVTNDTPAVPGFGLTAEQLERLRTASMKPEEIAGAPDVQHARVRELLHWFARFAKGHASPKWLVGHAMELAYYLATEGADRGLDIDAIKKAAYLEGFNISPRDRGILERLGTIQAAPALAAPATFMTDDQAREWAWNKVREDLGTKGWAAGDFSNLYGFFLHGWNYRGQYDLQRTATLAAFKQELTAAPALEAPAAPSEADIAAAREHIADVHNATQMRSALSQLRHDVVVELVARGLVPSIHAHAGSAHSTGKGGTGYGSV